MRLILERLPESSSLFKATHRDTWRWDISQQLLAAAVDALNTANWMNSKDGSKNRNRPDPVERPGISDHGKKKYGVTRMSFAEADAWLAGEGVTYATTGNDLII